MAIELTIGMGIVADGLHMALGASGGQGGQQGLAVSRTKAPIQITFPRVAGDVATTTSTINRSRGLPRLQGFL